MFINVTEVVNSKQVTRQQTVGGLLLNCDQMYPHELAEGSKTASAKIFELLREVSLNRRTKIMLANGKQVMRSEGLLGLWVRYNDSPLAVATTIINLVAQFKWLRNQHTKKILRLALHTVNAKPAEPPTAAPQMLDIDLEISQVHSEDSEEWASVVAVDKKHRVIARIANGLVFNPLAKGNYKSDRRIKNRGQALWRFIGQMDQPAPATKEALRRIRQAVADGRQVRLVVSDEMPEHALIVADAVKHTQIQPPAPRATHEAAVHTAKDTRLGTIYTARTGIDMEEDLLDDPLPEGPVVAWEHRLDARRVLRKLVPAGTYVNQPKQSWIRVVNTTRQVRHDDGQVELQTVKVLGLSRKDFDGRWVTYYYRPADVMANRSNPLKSARYSRILGRPTLEMTHGRTEPAKDIHILPDARWVRHQFYPLAEMLMRIAYRDYKAAQFDALPYEAVEAQEEFHHRTMRQDGQHHEEDDSEGRFDQHDDAILGQSDQERTEHELALEESDRSAYDLTLTGELDARTAAWLSNIPAEPIINPFRRRTVTYGVEEDLVLPGHVIASDTMVRDCIVRKVVDGIVYEGYVMPAPEQVAASVSGGLIKRIKVIAASKTLSKAEQMAANGGDWWNYRSYSGTKERLAQHLLSFMPPLRPLQPAPMPNFPPIEMELPLLGVQCDQVVTDKGVAWKMAGVGKVKWQVVYTFMPNDPWHEPLADDDTQHLVVTQDDDSSLRELLHIIEREPLTGGNADIVSPRPVGWKRPQKFPRRKVSA